MEQWQFAKSSTTGGLCNHICYWIVHKVHQTSKVWANTIENWKLSLQTVFFHYHALLFSHLLYLSLFLLLSNFSLFSLPTHSIPFHLSIFCSHFSSFYSGAFLLLSFFYYFSLCSIAMKTNWPSGNNKQSYDLKGNISISWKWCESWNWILL